MYLPAHRSFLGCTQWSSRLRTICSCAKLSINFKVNKQMSSLLVLEVSDSEDLERILL